MDWVRSSATLCTWIWGEREGGRVSIFNKRVRKNKGKIDEEVKIYSNTWILDKKGLKGFKKKHFSKYFKKLQSKCFKIAWNKFTVNSTEKYFPCGTYLGIIYLISSDVHKVGSISIFHMGVLLFLFMAHIQSSTPNKSSRNYETIVSEFLEKIGLLLFILFSHSWSVPGPPVTRWVDIRSQQSRRE